MSTKTDKKRELILKSARDVFAKKGFKNVTMKDIVEASEISRGGLYLYYDNTKDIFTDVLEREKTFDEDDNVFKKALNQQASASDLLALFLQEQKNELTGTGEGLGCAIFEFYFDEYMTTGKSGHKFRKKDALNVIEGLLKKGNTDGDLFCDNPHVCALNMVLALEGMRILKETGALTDKEVNDEILYLLGEVLN